MDWFRAHHGITSDSKWPVIAKISGQKIGDVVAVWIALLEHASQSDDRGHILGFDAETIDTLYGYEDGTTESIVAALKKKGMIFDDWILNWAKRQPDRERDDDSAERVKRFRERQKQQIQLNQCNTETTQSCNANVTLHVTDVTPCNAQNREEQRRTEKKKLSSDLQSDASASVENLFEKFGETYPRHEAKHAALKKFKQLNPDEELVREMIRWIGLARQSLQWQDKQYIPLPATWLNQRRWEGDPPPMASEIPPVRAPAQRPDPYAELRARVAAKSQEVANG